VGRVEAAVLGLLVPLELQQEMVAMAYLTTSQVHPLITLAAAVVAQMILSARLVLAVLVVAVLVQLRATV